MQTLQEILAADGKRPQIIADTVNVLEQEIARKKGVGGFAVKQGFNFIRKLENGRKLEKLIDKLLPSFVTALEPYYHTYTSENVAGDITFATYLSQRDTAVANSLLAVTDAKRDRVENKMLGKTYDKLRKSALRHVVEAVPAVGRLIEKHTRITI